jgi:hypothetical protein
MARTLSQRAKESTKAWNEQVRREGGQWETWEPHGPEEELRIGDGLDVDGELRPKRPDVSSAIMHDFEDVPALKKRLNLIDELRALN